jgi:DNA-directed RNA polymerase specialized sigma24 family protein
MENKGLWETAIDESIKGDNKLFNKLFLELYESKYKTALRKFVAESYEVEEVYTITMTKFWERFVVQREELPNTNIEGYIYRMAYNAHFHRSRYGRKEKPTDFSSENEPGISKLVQSVEYPNYLKQSEQDSLMRSKLLQVAIDKLDEVCKRIISENVMGGMKLKELDSELSLKGSYSALVHKKKRCIKLLTKLIYIEMKTLGISEEEIT